MSRRLCLSLAVVASTAPFAVAGDLPVPPGTPSKAAVAAGRDLFTMNFARPRTEGAGGGLGHNGNGLGPLYNETSCVACHSQAGTGGAGGLEKNVILAGIVTDPLPRGTVPQILAQARQVHPALDDNSPVVFVQRSSTGDREQVAAYDKWRDDLLATFSGSSDSVLPRRRNQNGVIIELVQRNTPALWGMGEIEKLRDAGGDAIRRRLADEITAKKPWITGRAPVTADGEDGWYGWRGQVASLDRIIRGACASEMGIQVPGAKEAASPVAEVKKSRRQVSQKAGDPVDLTEDQVGMLASFVRDIPRPTRRISSSMADSIHNGERLFDSVGCADCHVPNLGSVKGLYSDQLLHDMGEATADVQAAAPYVRQVTTTRMSTASSSATAAASQLTTTFNPNGGGGYASGPSLSSSLASASSTSVANFSRPVTTTSVVVVPTRRSMEWKTPPLWGVRDSYPYFHDGRAATIEDAIQMHGGEGQRSADQFRMLNRDQQDAIVTFLESLTAPPPDGDLAQR